MSVGNLIDKHFEAMRHSRMCGRTHWLCKAAKESNGIVVCADRQQADGLRLKYGVRTCTLDDEFRGVPGPFHYDHYAVECLLLDIKKAAALDFVRWKEATEKAVRAARLHPIYHVVSYVPAPPRSKVNKPRRRKKGSK